jgi:hypothetical protein
MILFRAARDKRGRCPHFSTRVYRKRYRRADGTSGEHLLELCLVCGTNARGAGRWVARAEVPDPDALPVLPGAAPEPTLFEEGRADA